MMIRGEDGRPTHPKADRLWARPQAQDFKIVGTELILPPASSFDPILWDSLP
jgi:hypothetical protein